ncbi:MAG: hypothetical protein R3F17_16020 [Planctomycetota bacterium]
MGRDRAAQGSGATGQYFLFTQRLTPAFAGLNVYDSSASFNPTYTPISLDVGDNLNHGYRPNTAVPMTVLAIYFSDTSGEYSIWTWGLQNHALYGTTKLKTSEHSSTNYRSRYPAIATTAARWTVSYVEYDLGVNYTCYTASLDWTNQWLFGVSERRQALAPPTGTHDFTPTGACSRYSGGFSTSRYVGVSYAAWDGTYFFQQGGVFTTDTPTTPAVQYCYGTPNSTGTYGFITMFGSPDTTSSKTLHAEGMPLNQFGYFLAGQGGTTTGTVPGSAGLLCVLGALIGRYNLGVEIFFTGTTGTGDLVIAPTALAHAHWQRRGLRGPALDLPGLAP